MEAAAALRSDWPLKRWLACALAGLVLLASGLSAYLLEANLKLIPGPNEYNVVGWETRNFANKWLFELGSLFRDDLSLEQQNASVRRFFELAGEFETLEREISDAARREVSVSQEQAAQLAAMRRERDRLENQVEASIESRVSTIAKDEGITRSFLGLPALVWPPVDFEFTQSPRSLATSPRDRIELKGTAILREDLTLSEVERIEDEKLHQDNVAALAFSTSGIGAYPTIVDYTTSYRGLLEVVAHEWMHNYLVFRPLGFNYYDSFELRSMNETVADLVGRELAARAVERWPLENGAPPASRGPVGAPDLDIGAELRELRGEVDALLAAGMIEEAETIMEQRRRELVAQGTQIRKINQAFFAFTNLYAGEAGSPAATNPIGPKIDELRRRSASLREFVNVMGNITSVAGLDQALARQD